MRADAAIAPLVWRVLDGQQAVLYRSRMNPVLGRNFEALDPLEWLARISDHIPDPRQHRTIFYGEYSSRARAGCQPLEPDATSTTPDHPPPRRRCPPSWARLIAKVYEVDPLVCSRCGRRMSILAFVSDQHSLQARAPRPRHPRRPPSQDAQPLPQLTAHLGPRAHLRAQARQPHIKNAYGSAVISASGMRPHTSYW